MGDIITFRAYRGRGLKANFEVGDGLTLHVTLRKQPMSDVQLKNELKDLHMVTGGTTERRMFLLFKSVEATEKAHKKLSAHANVTSVEFCGFQALQGKAEITKLILSLKKTTTIEAVKQLHDFILDARPFRSKRNTFFVEFPSTVDAIRANCEFHAKKVEHGIASVRFSRGLKKHNAYKLQVLPNNVCLRDVPKTTTTEELLALAPSALGATIYKNTFLASDYCHAAIDFSSADEAKSFISEHSGSLKLNGKKVYVLQGLKGLLSDVPEVGEPREPYGKRHRKEREAKKQGPTAKKLKLENPPEDEEPGSGECEAESGEDEAESGDDEEGRR